MALSRNSLDIKFSPGISNFFVSCNNFDNFFHFIYFFKPSTRSQKPFFALMPKSIYHDHHHHHHHLNHLTCYIAGLLHQCIYPGMVVFCLFVYKVNPWHFNGIAIHVIWNILTMKICFEEFIPRVQLTMHVVSISFYRVSCQPLKQLWLSHIQIFL